MKIDTSIALSFVALASEAFANCLGPHNAARFMPPGWGINSLFAGIPDAGIIPGCNNGCDDGPNFSEYSRGISGSHIFTAGPGFVPMGRVSGVGVPNNFLGCPGYPGNSGDQGTMGELSYVPSDATNPTLNFWGRSFPPGVPGNLVGLRGLGFDTSQGGFPGFHGFGGLPGVFGPPMRAKVPGQRFRGLNGQSAAIASPPAGDATLGEPPRLDHSDSRLLSALENDKSRGSSKKSNRQSSRNRNRNRNVNTNVNQA